MRLQTRNTLAVRWPFLLVGLWIVLLSRPVFAASTITFKLIAGRPCASGTLHSGPKAIPANIVIDLGVRGSLLVHKNTAKLLQLGPESLAELRFGDVTLGGLKPFAVDARDLEELSKEHAEELGEVPAVAVLGLPALANYVIRLDVGEGKLELFAPGEAPPVEAAEGRTAALDYEEEAYGVWLTARAADDFQLRTRFMTSQPDTVIDSVAADLAGSAAGALDEMLLGGINIARFVAFRPEDLSGMPQPRPDLALGTNLLSSFRVTIDPASRRMTFEQTREPKFPEQERAYYIARTSGDPAAIEQFLQANGDSRLASEASDFLLQLRLEEEPADTEAIVRSMQLRARHASENRRAALMVMLADGLIASDKSDLAEKALDIGEVSAGADLNGVASFQIAARRGQIALNRDDLQQARRHLLSAAFGTPRDPLVNILLGRLYERTGKPLRAWSRYLQAALDRSAPAEAMLALDRINRDLTFRAKFSMTDAEQLLEGRILEFHPAERHVEESAGSPPPVRLVELFNSVDGGGTCAPELAFQGLSEYFEETPVVFVQYHLNAPSPDPLAGSASESRGRLYQTTTAPAAFFDGQGPVSVEGTDRDVEQVYREYRKRAAEAASSGEAPANAGSAPGGPAGGLTDGAKWQIIGTISLRDDDLRGTLSVAGPALGDQVRLHAILCEKLVMLPGANGVMLHRYVARALLSPDQGFALTGEGTRRVELAASFARVAKEVEGSLAVTEKALDVQFHLRPTYVDRSALIVAAFLQDGRTREVLAACSLPVSVPSTAPAPGDGR